MGLHKRLVFRSGQASDLQELNTLATIGPPRPSKMVAELGGWLK